MMWGAAAKFPQTADEIMRAAGLVIKKEEAKGK